MPLLIFSMPEQHQDILLYPANISTSVQGCFYVDMMSRRRTTSNQRWNNVVYVNVEIYILQQRWNNIVYFNVELDNVRQHWNKVVIFNVDFYNVETTLRIWLFGKKFKPRFINKIIFLSFKEYGGLKILILPPL